MTMTNNTTTIDHDFAELEQNELETVTGGDGGVLNTCPIPFDPPVGWKPGFPLPLPYTRVCW
jgi:hypothetical protein